MAKCFLGIGSLYKFSEHFKEFLNKFYDEQKICNFFKFYKIQPNFSYHPLKNRYLLWYKKKFLRSYYLPNHPFLRVLDL